MAALLSSCMNEVDSALIFSFLERTCNSNCRFWCFNCSNSSCSLILEDFSDFFLFAFGVVTIAARIAATDGVAFRSASDGNSMSGNWYSKSGFSFCLTDLLDLEAAIVEYFLE